MVGRNAPLPVRTAISQTYIVHMSNIQKYEKELEAELLVLLRAEPDWNSFTNEGAVDAFKKSLLDSETYICQCQGKICGYLRALVDGFGVYVSELYIAPKYRNKGYGRRLLGRIKSAYPHQDVFVFSDEDLYYEKLGFKRIGSIFQL